MSSIFTRKFAAETAERAIKTVAQSLVSLLGVNATGVLDVDWRGALSAAALAGVISVLMSIGSGYVGDDSPSLVD